MSTAVIVSLITLGVFLLIAIAITQQTLEKNAREKRHRISSLNARTRNIDTMLAVFPSQFLHRELQQLLLKSLTDIANQLVQLDPKNNDYATSLAKSRHRLIEFQNQPDTVTTVTLSDEQHIKDVQAALGSLYNFINNLAVRQHLTTEQANNYTRQVRRLLVQTANDALARPMQDALANHKYRLAIHYLHIAKDKLEKEDDDSYYAESINQLNARIEALELEAVAWEDSQRQAADSQPDTLPDTMETASHKKAL